MASPHPQPSSSDAPAERRRADRARMALVQPWSRRRARRVGLVALVLGILGPLLGTAFALVLVPAQPGDVLPLADDRRAVVDMRGTVRGIDTATGEMVLRLVVDTGPAADESGLFAPDGTLTEDLTVLVNDATGQSVHTLPAGAPAGTISVTLALTDSRATRYPLDRYRSTVFVYARRATAVPTSTSADAAEATTDDEEQLSDQVPVALSLRSSDSGFSLDVLEDSSTDAAAAVDLRVARRATVVGWAGFFVLVCWLLAISAASIGWTTVVHGIATPAWAWGFLIGVLFALPPLRNALPGAPPSGSLVDLAAFYWAVGIVALTLVAMIGSWNVRVRRAPQEPDAPRPRI